MLPEHLDINGKLVAEKGKTIIEKQKATTINNFSCSEKKAADFVLKAMTTKDQLQASWVQENGPKALRLPVIEALDGQLITNKILAAFEEDEEILQTNSDEDLLKIVVVNRYRDAPVAKSFIKNFGLKKGAIASSVAHDSHNIVAVGVEDSSIAKAVNLVIREKVEQRLIVL